MGDTHTHTHARTHARTHTHAPTHTHTCTHTRTHAHKAKQSKAKLTAAVTELLPPSDNTGIPGTTQTLEPSAANPPGVASNPQEDCPGLTDRDCRT